MTGIIVFTTDDHASYDWRCFGQRLPRGAVIVEITWLDGEARTAPLHGFGRDSDESLRIISIRNAACEEMADWGR